MHETYLTLLTDPAHIGVEFTYIIVFDVLLGGLLWPLIKRAVRRHDEREHSR